MKNILQSLGMGDGEGNTSSTRVIAFLLSVGYLASKFYNSHLTHTPIEWGNMDLGFIGTIGGILVAKSHVENQAGKPAETKNQNDK